MSGKPRPAGATGQTVASNVRRFRQARDMSLQALATELERHGRHLSVNSLWHLENGRKPAPDAETAKQIRRVDVDDLVALAAALDVEPAVLLVPPENDPARGGNHRAVRHVEELSQAVRDAVAPAPEIDVGARIRTARRLMAHLGLELDEIIDAGRVEVDG